MAERINFMDKLSSLLLTALIAAKEAGRIIIEIYNKGFEGIWGWDLA